MNQSKREKGRNFSIAPQGTGIPERRFSSGEPASGIRRMNHRLTSAAARPMPKTAAYSDGWTTRPAITQADASSAARHPRCMNAWSRERKRPRVSSGTRAVNHGNHAPEEKPRRRLNANSDATSAASRKGGARPGSTGRIAMQSVKNVRAPHPARMNWR